MMAMHAPRFIPSPSSGRSDMQYCAQPCPFLQHEVWAICTKQTDSTWRIVNCLDKSETCFSHPCLFAVDGGEWPFPVRSVTGACGSRPEATS